MDRIDRLMRKVRPKDDDYLKKNNPFLGRTDRELLELVGEGSEHNPTAEERTRDQWSYALTHAPHEPSELELEDEWTE